MLPIKRAGEEGVALRASPFACKAQVKQVAHRQAHGASLNHYKSGGKTRERGSEGIMS